MIYEEAENCRRSQWT